ncbi:MAG: polyol transport system permease protein [Gaiellaceae bacterium]|nr:polyol transport system permease protein [Gaiellaceae bacterium]
MTAADATLRGKVGDPFSSPWRRRLPLLPALLFTIAITQLPFLVSIYYSFTNLKDRTQSLIPEPTRYVGIDNYQAIFSDPFFREAMWTSVKMTVLAVLLSLVFGTLFAILLDRKFFGQGFVRTLLITPFLLMPVVAALIWKQQMFSSLFGILDKVIEFLGFSSVAFISDHPLASIITVLVWQWTPFMMLIMLAGLQSQPSDIIEAAGVDGATPFAIFRQLTLPHLRRYLELGALLGSIYIVQAFDAVDQMTGGGPGSTNIPYFVYQESIGGGFRYGSASAYAIVVVVFSIVIATFSLRVLSGLLKDEERA